MHTIKKSALSVFITLTYDNDNMPTVELDENNDFLCFKRTSFKRDGTRISNFISSADEPFTGAFNTYVDDIQHKEKLFIPRLVVGYTLSKTPIFSPLKRFGIVYRKDVQDFLKRFRINLARNPQLAGKDLRFSYFICSEYGPQTYRPHYHGILCFRDTAVGQYALSDGLFDSWNKCTISKNSDGEFVSVINNTAAATKYVSKYVSCESPLPLLLQYDAFRPFQLCSKSLPLGSDAINTVDYCRSLDAGDGLYHSRYYDKEQKSFVDVDQEFPRSCTNSIFPGLLGSQYLRVQDLRDVLKRAFECAYNGYFPDYRDYFTKEYGLIQRNRYFSKTLLEPKRQRKPEKKVTPTKILYDVYNRYAVVDGVHVPFADLYLFGFEQNRCAFRKIREVALKSPFHGNFVAYFTEYLRHQDRRFANSIKHLEESVNLNATFSPRDLALLFYNDGFQLLPKYIMQFKDDSHINLTELLLNFNFNLSISDFYDDAGVLISPSVDLSKYVQYLQSIIKGHLIKRDHKYQTKYFKDG